jgi:hypothetical protein
MVEAENDKVGSQLRELVWSPCARWVALRHPNQLDLSGHIHPVPVTSWCLAWTPGAPGAISEFAAELWSSGVGSLPTHCLFSTALILFTQCLLTAYYV